MQYLSISNTTTLSQLTKQVGERNVDAILNANSLTRQPNIGAQLLEKENAVITNTSEVEWERKAAVLNTMTSDSDVYEYAALLNDDGWKVLSSTGSFPGMLRIPETITLSSSVDVMGNGEPVSKNIYDKATNYLQEAPHIIDPGIFNDFSTIKTASILNFVEHNEVFTDFKLPWGQVTLYSSLGDSSVDFPVYPEELSDSTKATYDTMPDMLYQYEPWQVYKGSGPRSNVYTFDIHRDMWSGDHRDGACNQLIRFCEANCYPDFKGAAVNTSLVTLYIAGKNHITGILTDVSKTWDGPIGLDGFYLHLKLELTITEVSKQTLNYSSVMNKGLIE